MGGADVTTRSDIAMISTTAHFESARMKSSTFSLTLALLAATNAVAGPVADTDLAATLDAHVKAVQARDLPALEKTITTGEALELILPNGTRMTTRAAYVEMHRDWFKETNWSWALEPLAVTMTSDMAIVTARTHYEEREGGDITRTDNWLSLGFRKEAGGWRLVHDQNTRVGAGRG